MTYYTDPNIWGIFQYDIHIGTSGRATHASVRREAGTDNDSMNPGYVASKPCTLKITDMVRFGTRHSLSAYLAANPFPSTSLLDNLTGTKNNDKSHSAIPLISN